MGDVHVCDGTLKKLIYFQSVASKHRVNITVTSYVKLGNVMPRSLLYNDK